MTSMTTPPKKIATLSTPPSTIADAARARRSGRKLGPGTWTPAGGPEWITAGRATGASSVSYSRLASRPQ